MITTALERVRSSTNEGTYSVSIQSAAIRSATWWRAFRETAHAQLIAALAVTKCTLTSRIHENVNASTGANSKAETQLAQLLSAPHTSAIVENRRHNFTILMACVQSVMLLSNGMGCSMTPDRAKPIGCAYSNRRGSVASSPAPK